MYFHCTIFFVDYLDYYLYYMDLQCTVNLSRMFGLVAENTHFRLRVDTLHNELKVNGTMLYKSYSICIITLNAMQWHVDFYLNVRIFL